MLDDVWNSNYEKNFKEKSKKGNKKFIMIWLSIFLVTLTANIILIYNFFSILNKI